MSPLDRTRLQEALALAESSFGLTEPNPRVGCIIGRTDGQVLGRGATQQAGGAHAEVMALRDAQGSGHDVRSATAWVTLEPCAHHGRTPPCCDALIAAGLTRVVVATGDPHPKVAGEGLARLRAAGIEVVLAAEAGAADLAAAACEVNIGFFSRHVRGRPWVRLKIAASLDGRTALPNGASQWITGADARTDGHAWRRRASAVLTGIGTVLADDPRLDVRLVPSAGQPLRVIVDSHLRLPATARLLAPPGRVLVCCARPDPSRRDALAGRGAEVLALPGALGRVDLPALLDEMERRGTNELHVEAGAVLSGALWHAGLVDEVLAYLAPVLLGDGAGMVAFGPLHRLDQAAGLEFLDCHPLGADLRLRARTLTSHPGHWLPSRRSTVP
jgi:diaminohydroxyphosphoribosylaminopyrimidine deaminase/5-amino-6-(5-phosphoribosylamino)uracil reductase